MNQNDKNDKIYFIHLGQYDWALASKKFLAYEYFIANARGIGSSSQNKFMDDVIQFKAMGNFV